MSELVVVVVVVVVVVKLWACVLVIIWRPGLPAMHFG